MRTANYKTNKTLINNLGYYQEISGRKVILGLVFLSIIVAILTVGQEAMAAATYDLEKGIKAATDPIIEAIKAYWGRVVLIASAGTGLLVPGDLKQRAISAASGAALSGAAMLGILGVYG